jgi:hypothetical protein
VLKLPTLAGPAGAHIHGQVITGALTAGIADFLAAAASRQLRDGRMAVVATAHGMSTTFASDSLAGALIARGVKADEANAQARGAVSWMVGMASGGGVSPG